MQTYFDVPLAPPNDQWTGQTRAVNAVHHRHPRQPARGTEIVMYGQHGDLVPVILTRPDYSSASLAWKGFLLERHVIRPSSVPTGVAPTHILGMALTEAAPLSTTWRLDGQTTRGCAAPGFVSLRAAGADYAADTTALGAGLLLSVEPESIAWACDLLEVKGSQMLRSHLALGQPDAPNQKLAALVLELDHCVRGANARDSLYEETLLLRFSLQLVQLFRADGHRAAPPAGQGKLPAARLAAVQDYVWNNLARPIGIQDIARAVNLSAYHLCHQFRATLAVSLWQYVRTCRAVYARRLIARHPDMSLTDIADASGFESYTAFYHAFRKTHGVKPSHRGRPAPLT